MSDALATDGVLALYAPRHRDARRIVECEDAEIRKALGTSAPVDLARARRRIETARRLREGGKPDHRITVRRVEESPLIGYGRIVEHPRGPTIELWMCPDVRGQGLGRRALILLCRFAFSIFPVDQVRGEIRAENTRSMAVAESVGFRDTNLQSHWINDPSVIVFEYVLDKTRLVSL